MNFFLSTVLFFVQLVLPDGCFHLLEGNLSNSERIYSANFILLDTELMPSELHQIEKNFDTNSIIIRVIFDDIDHQLHFVQLERLHLIKREKQSSLKLLKKNFEMNFSISFSFFSSNLCETTDRNSSR